MLSAIILCIYFLMNFVLSKTNNELNINIEYGENDTIILFYNLTTNYSYFITFRSFENKQLKFGLFVPENISKEHSIEIFYQYSTKNDLFIICFHFILQFNNLDIQCKDFNLFKLNNNSDEVFLPSYNPLFVPMMYALSILMLLPVIIQHHRHKKAQLLRRHTELKRLSVSITQDTQNPKRNIVKKILSQLVENENIPLDIKLLSVPSTKTLLDDLDDNPNVTFTLENLHPFIHKYNNDDDNNEEINAHDCIAHLLNNTPWNTSTDIDQPLNTRVIHDCTTVIREQYVPTIISLHDDYDDDRKPILTSKKYSTDKFYRTNRTFVESDV